MFGSAAKWARKPKDRLDRLARSIEAIAESDDRLLAESERIERLRSHGAAALHSICVSFIDDLNARLSKPVLVLDPAEWMPENYDDSQPTLLQISLRGRLLQLEFSATEQLTSTEDFRYPYFLRGGVRSFNQDLLEQDTVDEQQIFCCDGADGPEWRFFDARTYRTGRIDFDYLASELERLL